MAAGRPRRWGRWLIAAVVVLAVALIGGPFVYIHFISGSAPAPLSLRSAGGATPGTSHTAGQPGSVDSAGPAGPATGTWTVTPGSQVGYRVMEVLFGQDNVAVGRTGDVAGRMTIRGTRVTAGTFTVQMATIRSDQRQRDAQFNGRIMDTTSFPPGS